MNSKVLLLLLIMVMKTIGTVFEEKDMICTEEFCKKYRDKNGCPTLSDECKAKNSTHSGVYLPYPEVCNCCDYCLTNVAEGEACIRGTPGMPPPAEICGPGLACTPNKNGPATCQPMKTKCTTAQKNWDDRRANGTLGITEVRPKCDDDGLFLSAHCIPGSICYCIATDGTRIFGEIPFLSPWDEHKMTCGCSLNHWKAQNTVDPQFLSLIFTARCNEYGLYDPLQCTMGKNASCLCVDPITGDPSIDTPIVPVSKLEKGKPTCFDPSMHLVGIYESECELLKLKFNEPQSTTATTFKVTEFSNPTCQPDGKFHRVQKLGTKRICVDPSGKEIENYKADVGSLQADSMECNCARAHWLLSGAGVVELPTCCSNGNYESWQCRRNECFCVNQNGDQVGVEKPSKDVSKLPCYKDTGPCSSVSS